MIGSHASALLGAFALLPQFSSALVPITNSSLLGTLAAPILPKFLTNNPLPDGYPWGTDTVYNTNPYTNPPNNLAQVRAYDFTIARGTIAPDGVNRSVILINNQFPGPTIEANWGDTIQVTVHNRITGPEEGTSLHWHGLLQHGTPFEDGVPGIQQCPIAPGQDHVFSFQADLYGTSWYHSHYSAQYAAGIFGPMIIHGPLHHDYDSDLGPVILSDWAHANYTDLVEEAVGAGQTGAVTSDIALIDGKIDAKFNFVSGQTYRLRLINTAAEASFVYSIDSHNFTVIAHDFVPVQPYTTQNITLGVGQRADIVVKATGQPNGAYWMRSVKTDCSAIVNGTALAAIYYQNANQNAQPNSVGAALSTACVFPPLDITQPAFPLTPPAQPATTTVLNITLGRNSSGNPLWFVNNSSFRVNYDEPPLLLTAAGNSSSTFPADWNTYNFGSNSSVRLVVYNTFQFVQHPMHLHGHNFWILDQGFGIWDGTVPANSNPQRRDVYLLHTAQSATVPSYIVIEFNQDNPGVWPFHCHIAWHVSAGLYINVLERPQDIESSIKIPQNVQDTCTQWKAWQAEGNIVDQIDSGERK